MFWGASGCLQSLQVAGHILLLVSQVRPILDGTTHMRSQEVQVLPYIPHLDGPVTSLKPQISYCSCPNTEQ
jgi:hypothetical protein